MILSTGAAGLLCQDALLHDCLRDAEYDIGVESGMNDIDGFIELTKLSKYEIESRLLNGEKHHGRYSIKYPECNRKKPGQDELIAVGSPVSRLGQCVTEVFTNNNRLGDSRMVYGA